TRRSIVAPVAGTTRDVIAAPASWKDQTFTLVDTGGLFGATTDPHHALVVEHGLRALDSAAVIVFVVDAGDGLVPGDSEIAARLRKAGKSVLLAINTTDDRRARSRAVEFYEMGFEPTFELAAEHGTGVYELLDAVLDRLTARGQTKPAAATEEGGEGEEQDEDVKIAFVGRPNVGKSSLVNRLLREERVMVSDIPGT